MGSSKGQNTTIQKSDPWSGVQPYLIGSGGIYPEAQKLFQAGGPKTYPGQTYADFTPTQLQAQDLSIQRALNGSPVTNAAQTNITDTLNGNYLYGGPGFDAALNAASNRIIPQVNSSFEANGRYGSGLNQVAQTQALGDSFASLYNNERGRQMQAGLQAPGLANTDLTNLNLLSQVGAQQQGQNQNAINDIMNRYNYAQQLPYSNLQNYASLIVPGAGLGRSQSATSPFYRNRTAGALGGAASGAALGAALAGGGAAAGGAAGGAAAGATAGSAYPIVGTAIGAIAGGLLGAYG